MRGHVASNILADMEPEFLILSCRMLFGDERVDLPLVSARPQPFRKPSRFAHSSLRSDFGQSLFVVGNDDRIVSPRSKFGCGKMAQRRQRVNRFTRPSRKWCLRPAATPASAGN
jgi:hypothetical protein